MEKLEVIEELKKVEATKIEFEKQLRAIESSYFEQGTVSFTTHTKDFTHRGSDKAVEFNRSLLRSYLQAEIKELEIKSTRLIGELVGK